MRRTLEQFLVEKRRWSEKTFGPGMRTKGIVKHIQKELQEILEKPDDLEEWTDVITLAMDGFIRAGGKPEQVIEYLYRKFEKNQRRTWPTPTSEDEPVEHVRLPWEVNLSPRKGPWTREECTSRNGHFPMLTHNGRVGCWECDGTRTADKEDLVNLPRQGLGRQR